MKTTQHLLPLAILILPLATPAPAQDTTTTPPPAATAGETSSDEDRGWLTGLIEKNLSGEGRTVRLEGFKGAFSSNATFELLTISDKDGAWLTIRNGSMKWSRTALLTGKVEIDQLTAGEIDLPRLPASEASNVPESAASGFSLPDLPVSIHLGELKADKVALGQPIIGTAVTVSLDGSATLANGEGEAKIKVSRIDGQKGELSLTGSYDNESQQAAVDLLLDEGANGIAATMMGVPGNPALTLAVSGDGPLSAFDADIVLTTDGQRRLQGKVSLGQETPAGSDQPRQTFAADLGGNVAPLFLPAYQDFFGDNIHLTAKGAREASGAMSLSQLDLTAKALNLTGKAEIGADGVPVLADLDATLALPDGGDVLLPLSGTETRVSGAQLSLGFDAAQGPDWTVKGEVQGLKRPDVSVARFALDGQGQILAPETAGGSTRIEGGLSFAADGLSATDPALQQALGPRVSGRADFAGSPATALTISNLKLDGADYGAAGDLTISGLDSAFEVAGKLTASIKDASRFSAISGQNLSGAVEAEVQGKYGVLSGLLDAQANLAGTDLAAGIAPIDNLLKGRSQIALDIARDTTGTVLRSATIDARTLKANASGRLAPGASDLVAKVDFSDLSVMGGGYRGALNADARMVEDETGRHFTVEGTGNDLAAGIAQLDGLLRGQTVLAIKGTQKDDAITLDEARVNNKAISLDGSGRYQPGASDLTAKIDFPDMGVMGAGYGGRLAATAQLTETGTATAPVRHLALKGQGQSLRLGQAEADRVLAGTTDLDLVAEENAGAISIERLNLRNPQLTATADGTLEGDVRSINLDARLGNMALLVPGFPGALSVKGRVDQMGARGYRLDLAAEGPGGTNAKVSGTAAADFGTADLAITGGAQAGLANAFIDPMNVSGPVRFDLRLNGAPGLGALSGTVRLDGGRFADPGLNIALENMNVGLRLANSQAQLDAAAALAQGGRITAKGPIGLTAPYRGDLVVEFDDARLRDPSLYDTEVDGRLTVEGPLTGGAMIAGRLSLDTTEIRVPSTGLGGASALPDLKHKGESSAVHATRARADMLGSEAAGGASRKAPPYGLNVVVDAPNRIFVRGRGLDAELGGSLRVRGTTDNVQPDGQFELVRGRLDILSKRFTLNEGIIQMQGSLVPSITFSASTETDGDTATITISGPADDPTISFSSSSGLPQEEVVSRLLFNRGLDTISPVQAAQLASAISTLAGRGGQGIIGNLRQSTGLDDLDLTTDDEGNAALSAGKYISDKAYTDVQVGSGGTTSINLNLDVTRNITLRGTAESDGSTGVGVYFKKDY